MTIGSLTPLHTPLSECFSIDDVRTLVAKQLGVDLEFVTSETHFTNDLEANLLDRVELMLAIEDQFVGVEITLRKGQRGLFFADLDPPQTFALRADEILGNERQTVWRSGRALQA